MNQTAYHMNNITTLKGDWEKNPRINGKSKAIQRKSHKEAYTYTLTKRKKGKKCIYKNNREQPNQ